MIFKITLSPLDIKNLLNSLIWYTAAMDDPRLFPIEVATHAFVWERMNNMRDRIENIFPAKRKKKIKFTASDLTAILLLIEKLPVWDAGDDHIKFPIEELDSELMREFINWRSIHNVKHKVEFDYFIN